jgi:hypothetical protein
MRVSRSSRPTRVMRGSPGLANSLPAFAPHGAELEDRERPLALPHPDLPVQDRFPEPALQPNGQADPQQYVGPAAPRTGARTASGRSGSRPAPACRPARSAVSRPNRDRRPARPTPATGRGRDRTNRTLAGLPRPASPAARAKRNDRIRRSWARPSTRMTCEGCRIKSLSDGLRRLRSIQPLF